MDIDGCRWPPHHAAVIARSIGASTAGDQRRGLGRCRFRCPRGQPAACGPFQAVSSWWRASRVAADPHVTDGWLPNFISDIEKVQCHLSLSGNPSFGGGPPSPVLQSTTRRRPRIRRQCCAAISWSVPVAWGTGSRRRSAANTSTSGTAAAAPAELVYDYGQAVITEGLYLLENHQHFDLSPFWRALDRPPCS